MRRSVVLLTVAVLALALTSALVPAAIAQEPQPPTGWQHNPATGHFYEEVGPMTWAEAEAYAVSVGGHLVTINDQAEQDWLEATFAQPNLWIGMNDRAAEGTWVWSSGEPVTYTNWIAGEPNNCTWCYPEPNQGEDAAVTNYWKEPSGPMLDWNDLAEFGRLSAIVEVPQEPAPPTFWVGLDCDCYDISGGGWPAEVDVMVTADDPETVVEPDIAVTLTTNAEGSFYEGTQVFADLQPGWFFTVTDGVITKRHTVRGISITYVDPATDIMRGTADPGTEVYAGGLGYAAGDYTNADTSGEWFVDVTGVYDITPGSKVAVSQTDEDGDFTYTIRVVTLREMLDDMVADGRLPNEGVADSIMKQAAKAPLRAVTNHLRDLVYHGVITQQTMDQILVMLPG